LIAPQDSLCPAGSGGAPASWRSLRWRVGASGSSLGRGGIASNTRLIADEAGSWNDLHARYSVDRIDHGQAYSLGNGVYTNGAEEFFSRMRRAEIGHRHHVAGPYLIRYAQESAWREDHRRLDNGHQVQGVMGLAMACRPSVDWCGIGSAISSE
jgi:hypothetical protein